MWRKLGAAVTAVPSATRTMVSRRFLRGLLALPLAVAAVAITTVLTGLVLINVGYPLRSILGLSGHDGSVWASTYYDAWGGPTLAGAWTVHGTGVMLFVFPPLAWVVRGLLRVVADLTGAAPAPVEATNVVPAPTRIPRPVPLRTEAKLWRRAGVTAAALGSVYGLALLAHAAGIGDNVLWLPRDFRSGLALAVVLTPVVVAASTVRTWWRPSGTVRQ
ncbi:hypothetical protein O7627_07020 [Solwaraspora sp. WMMD1047]|uniref:hypothetical protein n=1 Tax=Solwaraspora sp. WMMD1047 TaxID=3016102 RepID=UPI0024177A19|nr:hypothetical protein [Solwaraspora sp. WMMD1047]MDG4829057.1 hypothetical protein [Solwaraspora sp. WMMD1047]